MKKITKIGFTKEANQVHNNYYDYSKSNYINYHTKLVIICPEHGEFQQTPGNHLYGFGCKLCGFKNAGQYHKKNTDIFIKEAQNKHGQRYDYSLVNYKGAREKIIIICPKHGNFKQVAFVHLRGKKGSGCEKCSYIERGKNCRMSFKEFLMRANKKHNNIYNYSKAKSVFDKVSQKKIPITCSIHGTFKQNLQNHLSGKGCNKCSVIRTGNILRKSKKDFISDAIIVHGNKYDYSKVKYLGSFRNVEILCKKDGAFWQSPTAHLSGTSCPKCSRRGQGAPRNIKRALRGEFDKKCKAFVYIITFTLPCFKYKLIKIGSGTGSRLTTVKNVIKKIGGTNITHDILFFSNMGEAIVFEHLAHLQVLNSKVIIPSNLKFPGHTEVFRKKPNLNKIKCDEIFVKFQNRKI